MERKGKGRYVFNCWGGPGLRRGRSFVNILQIWEVQTCFICNREKVIVSWQGKKLLHVG